MLVRLGLLLVWSLRRWLLLLPHGRLLLLLPHGRLLLPHGRLLLLPHGRLLLLSRWGGCCPRRLRLLERKLINRNPIKAPATRRLHLILAIMPRATHHLH